MQNNKNDINISINNIEIIEDLKAQRSILLILAIFLLIGFIWAYFLKNKTIIEKSLNKNNFSLINNDSLNIYKNTYYSMKDNISLPNTSFENEKIIYSVQIGAFKEFSLTSKGLLNLSENNNDDFYKYSIGNYLTYEEALTLKQSLSLLGFEDCFISAQSYGKKIAIRDALYLSSQNRLKK